VLPGPKSIIAAFAKNHGHFHGPLENNMLLHDISKHNNNKKTKKT
jgi:hypothetical protein